jgi:hypothetical protein
MLAFALVVGRFFKRIGAAIIGFFTNHPRLALEIVGGLLLALAVYGYSGRGDTIQDLQSKLTTANANLVLYSKALKTEKASHRKTISSHNAEVLNLKTVADQAMENAAMLGKIAGAQARRFDTLAGEFGKANPIAATCEARIAGEELTNDRFFARLKDEK